MDMYVYPGLPSLSWVSVFTCMSYRYTSETSVSNAVCVMNANVCHCLKPLEGCAVELFQIVQLRLFEDYHLKSVEEDW